MKHQIHLKIIQHNSASFGIIVPKIKLTDERYNFY